MAHIFKRSSFASQCYGQSDSTFGPYFTMTMLSENWLIFNGTDRKRTAAFLFYFIYSVLEYLA